HVRTPDESWPRTPPTATTMPSRAATPVADTGSTVPKAVGPWNIGPSGIRVQDEPSPDDQIAVRPAAVPTATRPLPTFATAAIPPLFSAAVSGCRDQCAPSDDVQTYARLGSSMQSMLQKGSRRPTASHPSA